VLAIYDALRTPIYSSGMGALDTYEAVARCPHCQDVHWISGQTKFFLPDFSGLCSRHFTPDIGQPLDFPPATLSADRIWDGTWWRVREPDDPTRLSLLADLDELVRCDCGAKSAVVLRFDLAVGAPPSATLMDVALLDPLAADVASVVDFADGENMLWTGDADAYVRELVELAYAARGDRAKRLHQTLVRHVTSTPGLSPPPWTTVRGPCRCEACGDVRDRSELTFLSHPDFSGSFFGPGWGGGILRPGSSVECDLSWLDRDIDRGYLIRVRHPIAPDGLRVLGRRTSRGCRCGAGRAAFVLQFARNTTGLTLRSLSLRVVQSRADLADVDFAEGPAQSREPPAHSGLHRQPLTRDEAVLQLLADVFHC